MRAGTSVKRDDKSSQAIEKGLHTKPFFGSSLRSQLPVRVLIERSKALSLKYSWIPEMNSLTERGHQ